ncbi:MAG: hypothetical protein MJ057_05770 [Sphaerochaetaceae bacterium]|nr:hypothetical protein [Sphaerochaetaceae bacterium]
MRKALVLVLAIAMAFALVSCKEEVTELTYQEYLAAMTLMDFAEEAEDMYEPQIDLNGTYNLAEIFDKYSVGEMYDDYFLEGIFANFDIFGVKAPADFAEACDTVYEQNPVWRDYYEDSIMKATGTLKVENDKENGVVKYTLNAVYTGLEYLDKEGETQKDANFRLAISYTYEEVETEYSYVTKVTGIKVNGKNIPDVEVEYGKSTMTIKYNGHSYTGPMMWK